MIQTVNISITEIRNRLLGRHSQETRVSCVDGVLAPQVVQLVPYKDHSVLLRKKRIQQNRVDYQTFLPRCEVYHV